MPSGVGYTLRCELPARDGAGTEAGFLTSDAGRLLLFETVGGLARHLRVAVDPLPERLRGRRRLTAWLADADLVPEDTDTFPLADVEFNLLGGRDAWVPDLLVPCRDLAAEIANALPLPAVQELLAAGSSLDEFDAALRDVQMPDRIRTTQSGLRSFVAREVAAQWRQVVEGIDDAIEWDS